MNEFDGDEKLLWHLQQLPGVVEVGVREKEYGLFRVEVTVSEGAVDGIWDELVQQVEQFERELNGEAGLDLEISSA